MLKLLTEEIKDFTNWADAEEWLARHGWGSALIEEQKLLWNEFKKAGTTSAELFFDAIAGTIAIIKQAVSSESESSKPAKPAPAPTKPTK